MRTVCQNVIRMPSGSKLNDFLRDVDDGNSLKRDIIEVCVPDSYALNGKNINNDLCCGCFNCIDSEDVNYITNQGSPSLLQTRTMLQDASKELFQGRYTRFGPAPEKLANHTNKNETQISNPLGALIVWNLSRVPAKTFFCSSPSWELSINTSNPLDSREGHLDITICSPDDTVVCVFEGKSSTDALLRDIDRDQWDRYKPQLEKSSTENDYTLIFSYLIGGDELGLYPENCGASHYSRRNELYNFIKDKECRFISVEALRCLLACKLSIYKEWNWETWFPKLFADDSFVGLLAGGIVIKDENGYHLQKVPWIK